MPFYRRREALSNFMARNWRKGSFLNLFAKDSKGGLMCIQIFLLQYFDRIVVVEITLHHFTDNKDRLVLADRFWIKVLLDKKNDFAKMISEKRLKPGSKGISEDHGAVGALAVYCRNWRFENGNGSKMPVKKHIGAQGMEFQLWHLSFWHENIYIVVHQVCLSGKSCQIPSRPAFPLYCKIVQGNGFESRDLVGGFSK